MKKLKIKEMVEVLKERHLMMYYMDVFMILERHRDKCINKAILDDK